MDITRFLPKNEYDASVNSSSPAAANPFVTNSAMTTALGAYVPIAGNVGNPMTGDLVMGAARRVSSSNGAFLQFDATSNRIRLQNRDDAFNKANMYILDDNTLVFQAGNFGFVDGFADNKVTPKSIDFNLYSNPFSKWGRFGMINNSSAAVSPFDFASFPAYAGIRNVTINQNVESVFCGGRDYIAKSNDGIYSNRYYLSKNNEAFELAIEHQTITGSDKVATFQNASGTVAYLSDITGGTTPPTLRNINTTDTFSTLNETLNCTSGTFTVNLPTAVGIQGTIYRLVNSGTGIITLDGNGAETINGSLDIPLNTQESRTVQSDGSNWIII